MEYRINQERLVSEFLHLTEIDAHSFEEREKADYLKKRLIELGFSVEEDDAGNFYGGNAGNLYACKEGKIPGEPILFSAHMDTVAPGKGIKAVVNKDGKITSDGTTILGADDNAGLASIIEAIRAIEEKELLHRDIELLFTIGEEAYIRGSEVFDYAKLKATQGYVLDLSGNVGAAATQAPTLLSFTAQIQGKAAHAGFAPDEGINAIQIAAKIIAKLQQGRIDEETTLNVGCIEGGSNTNIVSEKCFFKGEVRSLSHANALAQIDLLKCLIKEETEKKQATFHLDTSIGCMAYKIEESADVIKRFDKVCHKLKLNRKLKTTLGGSDNNNLVRHGIKGIVLACGMEQVHSCQEYIDIEELSKSAQVVLELMTDTE